MSRPFPSRGGTAILRPAAILLALAADLLIGIGRRVRVEPVPASLLIEAGALPDGQPRGGEDRLPPPLLIGAGALADVHRRAVEDRLEPRPLAIRHPRGDERATAAHTFGIDIRFVLADPGLGQRADDAAGGAASQRHSGR